MTSDIFDDLFGGFDAMNRRFEALFSDLKNCDNVKTYGYFYTLYCCNICLYLSNITISLLH